jgi:hypothetical protein
MLLVEDKLKNKAKIYVVTRSPVYTTSYTKQLFFISCTPLKCLEPNSPKWLHPPLSSLTTEQHRNEIIGAKMGGVG